MKSKDAVTALAALANETRLAVFRTLVQAGEQGMTVGAIGERVKIPNSTLSFHLKELSRAGLIRTEQESRFIRCTADYAAMDRLLGFLTENCCSGAGCDVRTAAVKPRKATA